MLLHVMPHTFNICGYKTKYLYGTETFQFEQRSQTVDMKLTPLRGKWYGSGRTHWASQNQPPSQELASIDTQALYLSFDADAIQNAVFI
jgi:hypothetical protein